MRIRFIGTIAVATLALAACGGGDDSGSGASPQSQVADMMLETLDEDLADEGIDPSVIDRDCVRSAIGGLSDEDAEKIVEAGPDGNPDVSADAEEIADSMFECVDIAAIAGG